MKVLIAPDSFKGSLTSKEVCEIISNSLVEENVQVISIPLSDGGEGFGKCCCDLLGGTEISGEFHDIYMNTINAPIYFCKDTAIIECASTCALQQRKDIMHATSYGVGEQIQFAYNQGLQNFIIGLGGSGMCDGGIGALSALGVIFKDCNGNTLAYPNGNDLSRISSVEITDEVKEIVKHCRFTYACDVTNPYCGIHGAAYIFAPQKGADTCQVQMLDKGLESIAALLPYNIKDMNGAGAAGGLCGGLYSVFKGEIKSGFDILSNLSHLEEKIKAADIIVTGEGKADYQTKMGKLPEKIANLAKEHGKRCVIICGDSDGTLIGDKVITLVGDGISSSYAIQHSKDLLYAKAKFILQ